MQLRGCGTALVTPFQQDGSIDEPALRNLVAWQVESASISWFPAAPPAKHPHSRTTSGCASIDVTIEVAAGRVPIVAGATSNSTQDAVRKPRKWRRGPG